jgi:hypothetical protein
MFVDIRLFITYLYFFLVFPPFNNFSMKHISLTFSLFYYYILLFSLTFYYFHVFFIFRYLTFIFHRSMHLLCNLLHIYTYIYIDIY